MEKRPKSVTIIAWFLIVTGAISLITTPISLNNPATKETVKELMSKNPIPIPAHYAMLYIGLLVTIISGIGMLKGQNWARLLYTIWAIIGSLIWLLTSPMKTAMIPGIAILAVIIFFLFRPASNQYFAKA